MITAIMFGIFLIFLGVGVPIAASVGWATLSVNLLDPSFACDAIYFVKTMAIAIAADAERTVISATRCPSQNQQPDSGSVPRCRGAARPHHSRARW